MTAVPKTRLTLQAYLDGEKEQVERNEFHRGEVFAMEGRRRVHGRVVSNIACRLGNRLDGSSCQVFSVSMKVQIGDDTVLYPDIFVTCDRADLATEFIFRSPTLVIEVLSPSTQACKRSQKFALYRRIPALREYILVDPDTRRVEGFRRNGKGQWIFVDMSDGDLLEAASVGAGLPLLEVFDGVDPPPEAGA